MIFTKKNAIEYYKPLCKNTITEILLFYFMILMVFSSKKSAFFHVSYMPHIIL